MIGIVLQESPAILHARLGISDLTAGLFYSHSTKMCQSGETTGQGFAENEGKFSSTSVMSTAHYISALRARLLIVAYPQSHM